MGDAGRAGGALGLDGLCDEGRMTPPTFGPGARASHASGAGGLARDRGGSLGLLRAAPSPAAFALVDQAADWACRSVPRRC